MQSLNKNMMISDTSAEELQAALHTTFCSKLAPLVFGLFFYDIKIFLHLCISLLES